MDFFFFFFNDITSHKMFYLTVFRFQFIEGSEECIGSYIMKNVFSFFADVFR